jgi:hypothetical protein
MSPKFLENMCTPDVVYNFAIIFIPLRERGVTYLEKLSIIERIILKHILKKHM